MRKTYRTTRKYVELLISELREEFQNKKEKGKSLIYTCTQNSFTAHDQIP